MYFRHFILSLVLLTLYACGSGDNNRAQNSSDNKATAEIPIDLQKLTLSGGGTLSAYITIDDDTANRSAMNINPAGAGSASLSIPGLSLDLHNITISYEYTLNGITYLVATASKNIDLSSGSDSLSFLSGDYEIDQYDNDGDGISNSAELKAGTDPGPGDGGSGVPHLVFASGTATSVPENTTDTGYQAVATAADGVPVTFALTGGVDQTFFSIDSNNGVLSFNNNADFEAPADSDKNNTYIVEITAIDGPVLLAQTVTVTVTNVNENVLAGAFVTTWKTDIQGFTANNQIKIGTSGGGYNYTVDWGDTQMNANVTGDITHTYAVPGTYTVSINGAFPRIFFGATTNYDNNKLLSIVQWGDIKWRSMASAFFSCINVTGNAVDLPDLSLVTNMDNMFHGASSFNQNLNSWNVSSVTSMSDMFNGASAFNQNISGWNVEAVKDMNNMFAGAIAFNQDIGFWTVSSVTNMQRIFFGATAFNGDLSGWDVSAVTNMAGMFREASAFNQNISSWVPSSVTNMGGMFRQASAFNQDISQWNVATATDMNNLFRQASAFNQDISGWNVFSVTDMNNMFNQASAFNQNLGSWNVSSVVNMQQMFSSLKLSTLNYDGLLVGWSAQSLQSGVIFSGGVSQYSSNNQVARDTLTNGFGWTISDGGIAP